MGNKLSGGYERQMMNIKERKRNIKIFLFSFFSRGESSDRRAIDMSRVRTLLSRLDVLYTNARYLLLLLGDDLHSSFPLCVSSLLSSLFSYNHSHPSWWGAGCRCRVASPNWSELDLDQADCAYIFSKLRMTAKQFGTSLFSAHHASCILTTICSIDTIGEWNIGDSFERKFKHFFLLRSRRICTLYHFLHAESHEISR